MVQVWWALEESDQVLAAQDSQNIVRLAGVDAMSRRARFAHPVDGDDHVAARVLTKLLLAHAHPHTSAAEWQLTQTCSEPKCSRQEPHGKPLGLHKHWRAEVSWAHASGLVACAVTTGLPNHSANSSAWEMPRIGIDVERVGHQPPPLVDTWQGWVRAESLVKAGIMNLDEALNCTFVDSLPAQGVLLRPDEETFIWDLPVVRKDAVASLVTLMLGVGIPAGSEPELLHVSPLSHLSRPHGTNSPLHG